jgi:hypothetical protein
VEEGVRRMNPEVLIAGSVGALLVFLLGAWRERRRDEKARRGLLQLLLGEIEHNVEVLRLIEETEPRGVAGMRVTPEISAFQTEIWQETRTRAAQLAPSGLFRDLYRYYSSLEATLSLFRLVPPPGGNAANVWTKSSRVSSREI